MADGDKDIQSYLARIRKTIADGERMVSQAELRMAETDRMLAQQGLTREQVMNFRFTDAQREAVNEELRRRGMEPLEDEVESLEDWRVGGVDRNAPFPNFPTSDPANAQPSNELAERQKKFGMMMKPFQI